MGQHIFISYSHLDKTYVHRLAEHLRGLGFDIWMDDRIESSDDWREKIPEAIKSCAAFIVIMSPDSDTSKWVQREVAFADDEEKPLFLLLLKGDVKSSKNWGFLSSRIQYDDVTQGNLPPSNFYEKLEKYCPRNQEYGHNVSEIPLEVESIQTKERYKHHQFIRLEPFEWCVIPAGHIDIAFADDSGKREFSIQERFQISKYPITNTQYQKFVDASNGYSKEKWWDFSTHARQWREEHPRPADSPFIGDLLPRVMVTWYEAMAYCRWLSNELGYQVRLPNEQEWQRAMQGDDGRKFPWGDHFDFNLCNFRAKSVTPVTQYPKGASPYGVMDMAGNICEWTLNKWSDGIPNVMYELEGGDKRVLRGYPHYGDEYSKVVGRCDYVPHEENNGNGFRIVTHSLKAR